MRIIVPVPAGTMIQGPFQKTFLEMTMICGLAVIDRKYSGCKNKRPDCCQPGRLRDDCSSAPLSRFRYTPVLDGRN